MIIDFAEKLLNSGHRATVDDAGVWTDNLNLKSVYFSKSKKDFESTAFVPVAIKIPYYNYQDFVKNADLPQIRKSEEILEKFALIKDNLIKKNHHGLYHETKKDINRSLFGTTDFNDK